MTKADIDAIVRGMHPDPFAVLGPHEVAKGLAIRVFRPNVRGVELVGVGDRRSETVRRAIHPEGLFEIVVPSATREAFDYRLRMLWTDGSSSEIDDPYRYGPVLTDFDLHLLGEGTHFQRSTSWAPAASRTASATACTSPSGRRTRRRVSVVGDFNALGRPRAPDARAACRAAIGRSSCRISASAIRYKFEIIGADGQTVLKADPCGRYFELPPQTASIVWDSERLRVAGRRLDGSARRGRGAVAAPADVGLRSASRQLAARARWTPADLSRDGRAARALRQGHGLHARRADAGDGASVHRLVGLPGDRLLRADQPLRHAGRLQVPRRCLSRAPASACILDWVPGHFPKDQHGLARFDGTALYEHADPRQGEHQDWGTLVFNYGRHEVRSFLLSNALFWLRSFTSTACASMPWPRCSISTTRARPASGCRTEFGGRENLEAIEFIKQLNMLIERECPGTIVVRRGIDVVAGRDAAGALGGLGLHLQVEHGLDARHARLHEGGSDSPQVAPQQDHVLDDVRLQRGFILPFSHDEVVHGKRSMLDKMPGDVWQKHANLRALYGYMFAHPGKKLLFMGGEIGQWREWNHDWQLDWEVLGDPRHAGLQRWVRDLNRVYQQEPCVVGSGLRAAGFPWIDCNDHEHSIIAFMRRRRPQIAKPRTPSWRW